MDNIFHQRWTSKGVYENMKSETKHMAILMSIFLIALIFVNVLSFGHHNMVGMNHHNMMDDMD